MHEIYVKTVALYSRIYADITKLLWNTSDVKLNISSLFYLI